VDFDRGALEFHHDTDMDDEGKLNIRGSVLSEDGLYGRIPAGSNLIR